MGGPSAELLGEVYTNALPGEDPVLYGSAKLSPEGVFEARSLHSFELQYQCGRYGLDDTGSIKVVFRFTADGGALQMHDPKGLNYVTATSSNGVPLQLEFDVNGHQRPWYQALTVTVSKGYLREGDTITIVYGDTREGSPGMRLQSLCETAFTWRVFADVCATGHYVPITESPSIKIVPAAPAVWKAVLPSLRRPGESFRLSIKAEDSFGNPSDQVDQGIRIESSTSIDGLPPRASFVKGERALVIDDLKIDHAAEVVITLFDDRDQQLAQSNPLIIREGDHAAWWGDMHGQSGESVGINTAREYFEFARNLAFLDCTSHQANDFQVNEAFWCHINELTAEFHQDGRFLTLPGYEWSGNTGVGGDRNVYFRHEGRTIRRSSHALIENREAIENDSPTARALFEDLRSEDCVVYAHIGGRPADVAYAHDARLETAMEIHSAWGTFEWLMADCFEQGYRVGVVANSDGHKGRPGASYPGASQFGAYGGLTCFLMDRLDRDSWFQCLRDRHHYATTGDRIHIDLSVSGNSDFQFFERDPSVYESRGSSVSNLKMGDIAQTSNEQVRVDFSVQGRAPIERIDVLNGMETVATVRNPAQVGAGGRIRVLWRGAVVKGRGARASWNGRATFEQCSILGTREINAWNPDRVLTRDSENSVSWESVTAGNFGAFDVWLEENADSALELETGHVNTHVQLADIGVQDTVISGGGLDLEVRLFRLPETLDPGPLQASIEVPIDSSRDNPLWIRVTTEDGFQAWTSPVYLFR